MKTVCALRHLYCEDLGFFAPILNDAGLTIRYIEAPTQPLPPDPTAADLVVILGGPIGADDTAQYPFLAAERDWIARRLAAQRPTLGICLGAQLMALALGARVYPNPVKEIGWAPLTLTPAGQGGALRHLDGTLTPVLHWHGDTFDLPPGATLLASTPACRHQAFALGDYGLGLQFHAEAVGANLENWFVAHTAEIAATPEVSVAQLRADTRQHSPQMWEQGTAFIREWLRRAGLL